jgi:hypothetical protein
MHPIYLAIKANIQLNVFQLLLGVLYQTLFHDRLLKKRGKEREKPTTKNKTTDSSIFYEASNIMSNNKFKNS